MKKILAILISALVLVFAAVPAFADVAAPQRQFNCVCGRSFTSEKKWSQHKQKCYVEVETTVEETSSAVETTVDTTAETTEATSTQSTEPSTTVATAAAIPTTEAKTETTTAVTTPTTVATAKAVASETATKVPVTVTSAPVEIPEETTTEEITTEMTTATTTVATTQKTTVAPTSTTSSSYSMIDVSFPEIKLSRINVEETVGSVQEDVPEETSIETTAQTVLREYNPIDKNNIPNTGSSKITVAATAMAIIAGGMIFAVKKKNGEKA